MSGIGSGEARTSFWVADGGQQYVWPVLTCTGGAQHWRTCRVESQSWWGHECVREFDLLL